MTVATRLAELGISLPEPAKAVANYVPYVQTGNLVHISGVVRIVKLGGFVQAAGDFTAIPAVINGCSDLMVEVFADKGRHARSAVGVYRLPLGFAVEVDAIVEVK